MNVSRALKSLMLFCIAALVVQTTMFLSERADGARVLTAKESSAVWGAGGGGSCTGAKKSDSWGCNTSPCTAIKNDTSTSGSDSKISGGTCHYTENGTQKDCGGIDLATKCDQ